MHEKKKKILRVSLIRPEDKSRDSPCRQMCEKNHEISGKISGNRLVAGIYCKIHQSFRKIPQNSTDNRGLNKPVQYMFFKTGQECPF